MICKWCGAKVEAGQRNCPSCGREIPPVSDCGGFYDIVPGAARPAPAAQNPPEAARQPAAQNPPEAARQPAAQNRPATARQPAAAQLKQTPANAKPRTAQKRSGAVTLLAGLLALAILIGLLSLIMNFSTRAKLARLEEACEQNDAALRSLLPNGQGLEPRPTENRDHPPEPEGKPSEPGWLPPQTQPTAQPPQSTEPPADTESPVSTEPAVSTEAPVGSETAANTEASESTEPVTDARETETTEATETAETTEALEPEPSLKTQELHFTLMADSQGRIKMREASIPVELQNPGAGTAMAVMNGTLFWKAALQEIPDGDQESRTFLFSYSIENGQLGEYANAEFAWKYLNPKDGSWMDLKGLAGAKIQDMQQNQKSELRLSEQWIREYAGAGPLYILCEMTRSSREGGKLIIQFETVTGAGAPVNR